VATTIAERIRADLGQLTRTERRVAQTLLANYPVAGLETVAEFARRARTSGPSILRFIAKLGFPSYAQFQRQLRSELEAVAQSPLNRYGRIRTQADPGGSPVAFARQTCRNIERAVELLAPKEFEAVVDLLAQERRPVLLIGGRFSGMLALATYQFLREMRANVRLVEGQTATWAEHLVDVDRRSVVLAFDFRRYQPDVIAFARQAAAQGATVVAFTDEWMSPVAAFADRVVTAPVAVPSIFDSTIATLVLVESMIARLGERMGEPVRRRIEKIETIRSATGPASP
jgi:DNA-binding MurR/RpiR family transcriptional regulator